MSIYRIGYEIEMDATFVSLAGLDLDCWELTKMPQKELEQLAIPFDVVSGENGGLSTDLLHDFNEAMPGALAISHQLMEMIDWLKASGCIAAQIFYRNGGAYSLVLPTESVDGFDLENSSVSRVGGDGPIRHVKTWHLLPDMKTPDIPLFRLTIEGKPSQRIFCNQEFRDKYESMKATGLVFMDM